MDAQELPALLLGIEERLARQLDVINARLDAMSRALMMHPAEGGGGRPPGLPSPPPEAEGGRTQRKPKRRKPKPAGGRLSDAEAERVRQIESFLAQAPPVDNEDGPTLAARLATVNVLVACEQLALERHPEVETMRGAHPLLEPPLTPQAAAQAYVRVM